jgi:drug/metabolite transporter (DMT)-like permease
MTSTQKAYSAAFLYAAIIGFSFLFVKISLAFASPLDSLAHRFTLSLLAASVPLAIGKLKLTLRPKDLLAILPIALLYPTSFFAFQVFGLAHAASSEAGIIQACIPVFTMILASAFLKERSTLQQKLAILLSTGGVIFIFLMKGSGTSGSSLLGLTLILLSALSSAGYNVLVRKMNRRFSLFDLTYVMLAIGFIAFNSAALVQHLNDHTVHAYFKPFSEPGFLLPILYLSLLSSVGTALLSNYALSILKASQVSVFVNLATVITLFAGVAFLNEQLQGYVLLGAAFIVIGVIWTQLSPSKLKARS